ncbi:UNVERIFIED_ORG: hypothetical protein ABIC97_004408 [Peribacillus simplex]
MKKVPENIKLAEVQLQRGKKLKNRFLNIKGIDFFLCCNLLSVVNPRFAGGTPKGS